MKEKMHEAMCAQMQGFRLPRYDEIPDVGLYLEQVTVYAGNALQRLQSVTITGSMISNYVKKGLVTNPVKKRYSRSQIAGLICIAVAKTVLALEDIQVLMDMQRRFGDIRLSYNFFCEELENALNYVFGMGPSLQELSEDIPDEGLLIRKTVVAVSHKIYLDTYLRLLSEELPGN